MVTALYLVAGFVLLWKGGDWLVDGADRFARGRGMPATLAGVFILGFATSAPELAVTVIAAFQDRPGIACGNVVGSNIANVGLVLGVAAVLCVVPIDRFLRRVEMPFAILASVLVLLLFQKGTFGRVDGAVVLVVFALYAVFAIATASRRPAPPPHQGIPRPVLELGLAAIGLLCLVGGADLFVRGATDIAHWLGVSDTVIGLTLVALGTSLPELATTVAAARSGRMELAVGNIVGSNIFNLLLVLGVASVILPQPDASGRLRAFDLPVMLALAVFMWVFALAGGRLRRWQGVLFLLVYVGYLAWIAVQTGGG